MIVKKKQISLITLFAVLAAMFIAFAVSASAAAPAKVKNFKVKSLGSHTLELQWDKVKGADGYVIYRAPYNSKKFTEIGRKNYNGTCVVKSGLNANTKYNFAIKAYKRENGKTVLSSTYPILSVCTLPPSEKISVWIYPNKEYCSNGRHLRRRTVTVCIIPPTAAKTGLFMLTPPKQACAVKI